MTRACECRKPSAPRVQTLNGERCKVCPDWMQECEARSVLAMPTRQQRQDYLYMAEKKRGRAAVDRLKNTIIKLDEARK